jgi:hypothetical protein
VVKNSKRMIIPNTSSMVDILAVGNVFWTKLKEKMLKERRMATARVVKGVRNKYIKYRF